MRLLIDNAVSPRVAEGLVLAGHDAVHVQARGLEEAADEEVFELAAREDRVLVSADTDFGTLLALRQAEKPSLILFRHDAARRPEIQLRILVDNLAEWSMSLGAGTVITIEGSRVRVRSLPIFRRG